MDHCHGSLLCSSRGVRASKIRGRQIRIATRVSPAEDRSSAPVLAVRHRDYSWNKATGAETRGIARLEVDSHLAGEKKGSEAQRGSRPRRWHPAPLAVQPRVTQHNLAGCSSGANLFFLRNIKWGKQRKQVTCDARTEATQRQTEAHRNQVRPGELTASELLTTITAAVTISTTAQATHNVASTINCRALSVQIWRSPRGVIGANLVHVRGAPLLITVKRLLGKIIVCGGQAMGYAPELLHSFQSHDLIRQVRRNGVTYAYALLQDFGVRCTKGEVL